MSVTQVTDPMAATEGRAAKSSPGEGLSGFQHYWPRDEDASGFGVATYIGTDRIICRLFNLETNELLDTQRIMGDFESLSERDLNAVINDLFVLLAQTSGVNLSKLTCAVVSGPTAMECVAAGVDPGEYRGVEEGDVELLGCDIEYLMAGPTSIAVGEAYYVPCLSARIGGDFLCSLLAIDILEVEEPLLFVNTGPDDKTHTVMAYGNNNSLAIGVLPLEMDAGRGIGALLDACGVGMGDVGSLLLTGCGEAAIPEILEERMHEVGNAAIEGASAVLLSESAEDQLSRIVEACRIIKL